MKHRRQWSIWMVVVHSTIPDFSSLSYSFFFSLSHAHAFFLEAFISWWGSHIAWLATHTVVSHCEELHMKCILSLNLSNTTDGFPLLIRLIWCITFVHRYWQSLVVLACLTWSCNCGWTHGYQIIWLFLSLQDVGSLDTDISPGSGLSIFCSFDSRRACVYVQGTCNSCL